MNAIVPIETNAGAYRASTDAAELCKGIVVASAQTIQGRRYVKVEGWQAIAVAHGCAASARDVERVDGGVRAIGEVRRMVDGVVIAEAEGFVGEDEPTWFGGETISYGKPKILPKRADYAIRAMAQTRAISRACRSAFAHVVVMMNAGLQTTPAEEVPMGGFDDGNVIEGSAVGSPAPRSKLEGPHTSKTALKNAIHTIRSKVAEAKDNDAIDAVMRDACETVKQANRDWPELLNGDPNIGEDIGLKGYVANRREAVRAGDLLAVLLQEMRQEPTRASLATWAEANEARMFDLSDTERRTFDHEYDAYEGGLTQVATLVTP